MKQKQPAERLWSGDQAVICIHGESYMPAEAARRANQEHQLGNFQAAEDIYNLILARFPDYAEAYYNRGIVQNGMKRLAEALESFDRAIALKPGIAEAHNNRGVTLKTMNRYAEALASYDRAVALEPKLAQAWNNRGVTLYEMKRYGEAVASYDRAIGIKPDYAGAYANRGAALEQTKQYGEALASYDRALALKPDSAATCQKRGNILVYRGNMPEAERMFHKAIALEPDYPDPLCSLANIRKFQDPNDPLVQQIRTLLTRPGIPAVEQENLNFALGKIYDDCDQYDEAFECYRWANQIRNASVDYDPGRVRSATDRIMDVFSKEFFAQPCPFASDSHTPLIIVGMPRSGTTLLANIFSNHRSVATAGELTTISDLTAGLGEMTGSGACYPEAALQLNPTQASSLIKAYEQRLRRDAGPGVRHVIDKHPLNFRHLGFIARLFPRARIVHCLRNPLDTGLSNYFQRFHPSYNYSFDLRNIGHFYGEYARLMEHWRQVLPLELIEISYEETILNTEPTVRRALAALGLEWDERCLAPHNNPCVVETASKWQVRQPIHRGSWERWRHYEKHLGPLKEMLLAGQVAV